MSGKAMGKLARLFTGTPVDALRTRRNTVYFCATCAVDEGEQHLEWCHRGGVMTAPEDAEDAS